MHPRARASTASSMAKKNEAYVDTSALIAFADRSDSFHHLFRRAFANPPVLVSTTLVFAECHRCDRLLARRSDEGTRLALACAIAIVILLPLAAFLPLMGSTFYNVLFGESRLVSSVAVIYSEVWFPFAFGFLFFALLFPWVRALLQVVVLSGIKVPQRGRMFRFSEELRIWSMIEVVVIAGYVA